MPSRFFLALYALSFAALHLTANLTGWYYLYPWLDIPMHIGGGIWVAWACLAYRDCILGYRALSRWIQGIGVVCAVALVGVVWELLEGLADASQLYRHGLNVWAIPDALGSTQVGIYWDTLFDLHNDLLGAVMVVGIWLVLGSRARRSS